MRLLASVLLIVGVAASQTDPATPPAPSQTAPGAVPVVNVTVPPLGPVDLDTPYASPRDAARQWLQATLANLRQQRDLGAAIRGVAQAVFQDPSYAVAVFDLGILAAIAEKWDDAGAAFDEAVRLDPATFGAASKPQAARARFLASLEKSPEGRRKRRYDEALSEVLPLLPKMSSEDALTALAEVGRIDPRRWEAAALLAALVGDGSGYQVAAKFLEIAARNAGSSPARAKLEDAKRAAEVEVRYESSRLSAEAAAENGKYDEAAKQYETAWKIIPARLANGLDAASASLLADDTARASGLLLRLRAGGDKEFSDLAAAMLKELEPVEPAVKSSADDAGEFFRNAGSRQPPRIAALIPAVDRAALDIYTQALPKIVDDPAPIVLLAALAADPSAALNAPAPMLPSPSVAGDHPWAEISGLRASAPSGASTNSARPIQTADLASGARVHRTLMVTSTPPGARVFVGESTNPACDTPCNLLVADGSHTLRFSLAGYGDERETVTVKGSDREVLVALNAIRGSVIVETGAPADLLVNGVPVGAQSPAELSLAPGAYRIGARFGADLRERTLMVKPGARLRLQIQP